jgi:hypothetical protein
MMQTKEDEKIQIILESVWGNLYEAYKDIIPSALSHEVSSLELPYLSTIPLLMHPAFEEFLRVII